VVRLELQRGLRRRDAALAAVLLGLAALLSVANINSAPNSDTVVDSHSVWQLPVVLLATLPVLWWRRDPVGMTLLCAAGFVVHDVVFGDLVRCGSGLPLTFVLAFLTGVSLERRKATAGLLSTVVLATAVLWRDTAAGLGILPVVAVICLVVWLTGAAVRSKVALSRELVERTEELTRLRDERAALEVAEDRQRLSGELQVLLDERLASLSALAERSAESADPEEVRRSLVALEDGSRSVLGQMRTLVGQLRGGEQALSPLPSVASLEALLARRDGPRSRLRVTGSPRTLPASVELSAYRIVEHVLDALDAGTPVEVTVHFLGDALELRVVGVANQRSETKAALARAAERARLHAGAVQTTVARGRASVLATLPIGAGA
jgi:signal transduction histidine kinase